MSMPGFGELIVIFLIILFIFGAGKIPKIAREIGTGIRDFKKALNSDEDENVETAQTKSDKRKPIKTMFLIIW